MRMTFPRRRSGSSPSCGTDGSGAYHSHQTPLSGSLIFHCSLFNGEPGRELTFEQSIAGSGLETFSTVGSASRVLNIVSTGKTDSELYLTFTFEWEHDEIEAGSKQALEKQKQYQMTAPKGVGGTLAAIRNMVEEGKL